LGERCDGGLSGSNGAVDIGLSSGNNVLDLLMTVIVQFLTIIITSLDELIGGINDFLCISLE
jgi:hypothetical protein